MEYLLLIYEFLKTRKKRGIIIPLIISGLVFCSSNSQHFIKNGANIQGNILTVVGILLGFSISIFAVFLAGNGGSIEEAKEYKAEYKLHQKHISLHTTVLIGLGYITLMTGILLAISVLSPIFCDVTSFIGRILFSINIFLLLHIIEFM